MPSRAVRFRALPWPIVAVTLSLLLLTLSLLPGCLSHERTDPPRPITASAVSMETSLTCAIDEVGAVRCSGHYSGFVLSRVHEIDDASVPLALPEARAIDVSADHACAATTEGEVFCWGFDTHGQLGVAPEPGDESGSFHATPVRVPGIDDAIGVAVGWLFSCALRADGGVACWGASDIGPVGSGDMPPETVVAVPGVEHAIELEADGSIACARTDEGRVFCFGEPAYDALGSAPVDRIGEIAGLPSDLVDIDVSRYAAVALDARGDLWNWGIELPNHGSDRGESFAHRATPAIIGSVPSGRTVIVNQLRGGTLCVLRDDGSLTCWGENHAGQLGRGYAQEAPLSAVVAPPFDDATVAPPLESAAISGARTCGIRREDHALVCWGSNGDGALLGGGTVRGVDAPASVLALAPTADARSFAIGDAHACAIDAAGGVWCWGAGTRGRLGRGDERSSASPVVVPGLASVTALAIGGAYSCALADGRVSCWGANDDGAVRGAPGDDALSPVSIALPGRATAIAAAREHACAIAETASGRRAVCWGRDTHGQLGNERFDEVQGPTLLEAFGDVLALGAGSQATCAVTTTGVSCVGDRSREALGVPQVFDATAEARVRAGRSAQTYVVTEPVHVPSSEGAYGISMRDTSACAWSESGSVCWGDELGVASARPQRELALLDVHPPTLSTARALCSVHDADACVTLDGAAIAGVLPATDLVAVHGSYGFACGLTSAREIECWGQGPEGELGDGLAFALMPTPLRF